MIKVGGENVDPTEVESYLGTYPGVSQAAVVSYPDARLGESVSPSSRSRPEPAWQPIA